MHAPLTRTPHSGYPSKFPSISLDDALTAEWLEMFYQPIVDLRTGEVAGAEGLSRARHPELGLLSPARFLPGASEEALCRLTEFVIVSALKDWESFDQAGFPIRLSVNAPPSALLNVPIAHIVREHRPQSPNWLGLVLELTEESTLPRSPFVREIAAQLRNEQVELSLDDYGQGYANSARLRALPFRFLKIDKSFVNGCGTDPLQTGAVRGIVGMAHGFGCAVIAEGIENADDLKSMTAMGCEYAQGHLLGHPMPRAEFLSRLH